MLETSMQKLLLFPLLFLLFSCKDNSVNSIVCSDLYLKDYALFPVGVSGGLTQINPVNENYFNKNFDRVTTTTFFPIFLWKNKDSYDYTYADSSTQYLRRLKKDIHAHCLLYALPSVSPPFLVNYSGSNEEFETLVKNFIRTMLSRYKGIVKSYDIFNELFDYNSAKTHPTWLRKRFSSDDEFFDFVGRCYRYAHQADPSALLFYNDYGQEFSNGEYEKGKAIFSLLMKWKKQGVPLHGYGLQMHTNIYRPVKDIEEALKLAVQTKLLIHISELDVSVNWADFDIEGIEGGQQNISELTPTLKEKQAVMYRKVAEIYRTVVPQEQQYGITLWDLSDKDSWLIESRFEAATIMYTPQKRKKAFYAFLNGLGNKNYSCE